MTRRMSGTELEWIQVMGLFGNKQNSRKASKSVPKDVEEKAVEMDKPLQRAMIDAVGIGSKDAKVVIVRFVGGRKLNFWVANGRIKHIVDPTTEVSMISRLQWTKNLETLEHCEDDIDRIMKETPFFTAQAHIAEAFPEFSETLRKGYAVHDTALLVSVSDLLVETTEVDWMMDDNDVLVGQYDAFDVPVQSINTFTSQYTERLDKAVSYLNGVDENLIILYEKNHDDDSFKKIYNDAETDEERLVIVAANSNSNLSEVHKNSEGFDWPQVVATVEKLMWKNVIDVDIPSAAEEEDLPEFDLTESAEKVEEVEESVPTDSSDKNDTDSSDKDSADADTVTDAAAVTDDSEEVQVVSADAGSKFQQEDDGGFEFEVSDLGTPEYLTAHLHDDLETPVNAVIREPSVSPVQARDIEVLLSYNTSFEKKLSEIEERIRKVNVDHSRNVERYEELVLSTNGDNDVLDNSEQQRLERLRSSSDDDWQSLDNEEKRQQDLNQRRRDVLTDLRRSLSSIDGDHVQEALAVVDAKLEGIENVEYTTFSTHEELVKGVGRLSVDGSRVWNNYLDETYTPESTPLFFKLVEDFDFNPFKHIWE